MASPPKDTAQKWMAFGAIVAVAVGVSVASNAFKTHLKSTLPAPAPPDPMPTSVPATPAKPVDPDDYAPPADDPPDIPSGSVASSLAARPAWAPSTAYAPTDHSRAADVFDTASSPTSDLSRAFVLCRGHVRAPVDSYAVSARAKIAALPELHAHRNNRNNEGLVFVSAPLVDAKVGDAVDIAVTVREGAGGHRPEGTVKEIVRLKTEVGKPLVVHTEAGDIECLALSGTDLTDRIAQDAGRADAVVARIAGPRTEAAADGWANAYPMADVLRAQRAIADVAALAGWDDARVTKRVAAYGAALAKAEEEERRAFDALHAGGGGETKVDGLTIVLDGFDCTTQTFCAIRLSVTNETDATKSWRQPELSTVIVARAAQRPIQWGDGAPEPVEIPSHATKKVLLKGAKELGAVPAFAQFCAGPPDDRACGVIRLR